jgi:hypothetical protein
MPSTTVSKASIAVTVASGKSGWSRVAERLSLNARNVKGAVRTPGAALSFAVA